MNSYKKRLFITGIIALFLLGIAASNSAIIKYIDSAYTQIITSDLSNRKAIHLFERECNNIQNTLVSMLLTEDSAEIYCLQGSVYNSFLKCDNFLSSLEESKFPIEHRKLMVKLRSIYLIYREDCARYIVKINNQERKNGSRFITVILQKNFTSLLSIISEVTTELDSTTATNSNTITKQNNLALTFITGAGIIPVAFWGILLLATVLGTSIVFGRIQQSNNRSSL